MGKVGSQGTEAGKKDTQNYKSHLMKTAKLFIRIFISLKSWFDKYSIYFLLLSQTKYIFLYKRM